MLRNRLNASLAATALVAGSFTAARVQTPQADPAVEELKAQVAELEGRVDFLEAFAKNQAAAGAELATALSTSEAKGFTAGINPESREVLLSGLRAQADAMKTGAGEKKEGDDEKPTGRRGTRRSR